jgi:hypothetical protein
LATTNLGPHWWKYAAEKNNQTWMCIQKTTKTKQEKDVSKGNTDNAEKSKEMHKRTTWARSTVCVGTLFGTPSSMPGRSSNDRCFKSARNDQANAVFSSGKPTSVVYSTW